MQKNWKLYSRLRTEETCVARTRVPRFLQQLHQKPPCWFEAVLWPHYRYNIPFEWTVQRNEHDELFNAIKDWISKDTILAIPNEKYLFHIYVDSSSVGAGSSLVQPFPEGKIIVSINSRIFNKSEQQMLTLLRELCGIVSALQTYEHFVIGSPHPVFIYCDHKPILYLWAGKGKIFASVLPIPADNHTISNSAIYLDTRKKLAFPDILSRNLTIGDNNKTTNISHGISKYTISCWSRKYDILLIMTHPPTEI